MENKIINEKPNTMWTPLGLITSQGMTIKPSTTSIKLTYLCTFINDQKWQFSQPWDGLFF